MSEYDALIKDTQALYKHLRNYFVRFEARKSALHDEGTLSDLSARDHTVNEWLYDIERRLRVLEDAVLGSVGTEEEKPVEIPLSVNHLKR